MKFCITQNFFEDGGKMIYKLNINDRAALAIKNKTKKIEIRANKDEKIDLAVSSTTNVTLTPDEDTVSYLSIMQIG